MSDEMCDVIGPTEWGSLYRSPVSSCTDSNSIACETARLTWRPSDLIAEELPNGFEIQFAQFGRAGGRLITSSTPESFVSMSAQAGLAIIAHVGSMDGETRRFYRTMLLLFQQAFSIQEIINRSFYRRQDLLIERAARDEGRITSVLPSDLGSSPFDTGMHWTHRQLMKVGRAAAISRGVEHPDDETVIRLGVLEAARQNPFDVTSLSEADAKFWLRTALFDLGPAEKVPEPARREIIGRLLDALDRHLELSATEFRSWFIENRDNLVHQIAKKKSGGVTVSRDDVRQVLLDLTFESFQYVGQCVSAAMHVVSSSMKPNFNEHERHSFDAIYNAERWLAGIPLAVLRPFLEPVCEVVTDLWEDPTDSHHRGVLLRALQFHAAMVRNRRKADRELKRKAGARTRSLSENEAQPARPAGNRQEFRELMLELGKSCQQCGSTDCHFFTDVVDSFDRIVVRLACNNCETSGEFECTKDELVRASEQIGC